MIKYHGQRMVAVAGGAALAVVLTIVAVAVTAAHAAPTSPICQNKCSSACIPTTSHSNGSGKDNNGPTHGCQNVDDNPCPHATCAETLGPDQINRIYAAATANDVEKLGGFLSDRRVRLNLSRSAIQVAGCTQGEVIAHIPISSSQIATLSSTLSATLAN